MANKREIAGIQLLEKKINIAQVSQSEFSVRSQSDPNKQYKVVWNRNRWICTCKDFEKHNEKCKHIHALNYYLVLRELASLSGNSNPKPTCPKCGSNQYVIKRGFRYNRTGPDQRYYCNRCKRRFIGRNAFKWMRNRAMVVAASIDLYFRGLSLRQVQQHLEDYYQIRVTHATIYNWLKKYVHIVNEHVENIRVKTSQKWHADETLLRVRGRHVVLWNLLDSHTRFQLALLITNRRDTKNAQALLRKGAKVARDKPLELITDGNVAYARALEMELEKVNPCLNQNIIHLQGPLSEALNNKMERFQGTQKSRLKTMHHLNNEYSAKTFVEGFETHYNFVRRHKALNGKTPAQAAKATEEKNSWLSLIQKAEKSRRPPLFPKEVKRKTD